MPTSPISRARSTRNVPSATSPLQIICPKQEGWLAHTRAFTRLDADAPIFVQKSAGIAPVGPSAIPVTVAGDDHGRIVTTSAGRVIRTTEDVTSTSQDKRTDVGSRRS